MKKSKLIVTISFFVLLEINFVFAQIPIGTWRDHLPYRSAKSVCEAGDKIYCATDYSLMSYDLKSNEITRYSRITGLSDIGFADIAYNEAYQTLIIGYNNTSIDLMKDSKIISIQDINRKSIPGTKRINDIYTEGNIAYLSCGFGIVVLNMEKSEIKDTWYLGNQGDYLEIYQIVSDSNFLYANTPDGIKFVNKTNPMIALFSSWKSIPFKVTEKRKIKNMTIFNNNLIINVYEPGKYGKDTLFVYENSTFRPLVTDIQCTSIFGKNDQLLICNDFYFDVIDKDGKLIRHVYMYPSINQSPRAVSGFISNHSNLVCIADNFNGLILNYDDWNSNSVLTSGPYNHMAGSLSIANSQVWMASGAPLNDAGVAQLIDNQWKWKNGITNPLLTTYAGFASVVINPFNPQQSFAGTYGIGLAEFKNGEFLKWYNDSNSTLQNIEGVGLGYIQIPTMGIDYDQNLWVANNQVMNPISLMSPKGKWYDFASSRLGSIMGTQTRFSSIAISESGTAWFGVANGGGILGYNPGSSLDNTQDDKFAKISIKNREGEAISDNVFCLAVDYNGYLWVGTDKGAVYFYEPNAIINGGDYFATQPSVDNGKDNIIHNLLETEKVTAIAVDAANRIWFGTQNAGVFLMAEDGKRELLNFNVENSPIFSNTITALGIDHNSGEVYIGTDKGMMSYRSDATISDPNFSKLSVFPNPVKNNYSGIVTVSGLAENVTVKITDVSGNLVYQTKSNGGTATWNNQNLSGQKVNTGVYFVFAIDNSGVEKGCTKILIIN